MKFVIQRVTEASVSTEERGVIGRIGKGFLVLIGAEENDTREICDRMVQKMTSLRIFADKNGKTNLSLPQVGGALLLVSQFTLYADCRKGNRPSFIRAGNPEHAKELYEYVVRQCSEIVPQVEQGEFGAYMRVMLVNDGPFTILLDSDELFGRRA